MLGVSPTTSGAQHVRASITRSAAMRLAAEQFEAALKTDTGVLIAGETGTGRELMARAIYRASVEGTRPVDELLRERTRTFSGDRPFITVDCGAPDVEKTLFGPVDTGASQ